MATDRNIEVISNKFNAPSLYLSNKFFSKENTATNNIYESNIFIIMERNNFLLLDCMTICVRVQYTNPRTNFILSNQNEAMTFALQSPPVSVISAVI
jgi:hypothetical protein